MFLADTAYAMGVNPAKDSASSGTDVILGLVPIVAMFVIFYFLIIRPQQKKQQALQKLLGGLKEGDNVITQSGIYGVVSKLKDDVVTLQVAEQVKIKVTRSSINTIQNQQ